MSQDDLGSRETQRPPGRRNRSAWLIALNITAALAIAVVFAGIKLGGSHSQPVSSPTPSTGITPTTPTTSATPAGSTGSSAAITSAASTAAASTAAASTAAAVSASPSPSSTPNETALSTLTLSGQSGITNFSTGPQQIGGTTYQDSIRFTAAPNEGESAYLAYDVNGYDVLTATVGVPDDATNAAGNTMTITFLGDTNNQLGSVTVAVGQPQPVNLDLRGSAQLVIACAATDSAGQPVSMDVALGDATLLSAP